MLQKRLCQCKKTTTSTLWRAHKPTARSGDSFFVWSCRALCDSYLHSFGCFGFDMGRSHTCDSVLNIWPRDVTFMTFLSLLKNRTERLTSQRRCQADVSDASPRLKRYFQILKVVECQKPSKWITPLLLMFWLCCELFFKAKGSLWSGVQLMWSLFPQATLIKQHH